MRNVQNPIAASKLLVDYALGRFSTDNLSCMIVRFDKDAAAQSQGAKDSSAEADAASRVSEVEKIVMDTKQKIADGSTPALGVSASNSGRGYDAGSADEGDFVPTALDGAVEEEPVAVGEDGAEVAPSAHASRDKEAAEKPKPLGQGSED